ncbi:MAG: DMT family transporter [Verrucomicrobia bacterium]|nr:DMT family transporter [Verrucomicrobiota bacterium]
MPRTYWTLLIIGNVFWAGILTINKALEPYLTYSAIVTLRFALSAIPFLLVWRWLPGSPLSSKEIIRSACMGVVVFVVGQRLQVMGNHMNTAGNASVLMGFEPVLTSLAAALFLNERIPKRRWIGFVFCLAGLMLLNRFWSPDFHWTGLWPSLVFVASFLCESVYSIIGKPLSRTTSPYRVVGVSLLAATAVNFLLVGTDVIEQSMKLPVWGWGCLVYLSLLCTVAGYLLWLLVLAKADVNLVALTVFVQPVAGVVIAWVYLRENPHWGQFWGALAIAAGLWFGSERTPPPKPSRDSAQS